jgi:hypothetical protein
MCHALICPIRQIGSAILCICLAIERCKILEDDRRELLRPLWSFLAKVPVPKADIARVGKSACNPPGRWLRRQWIVLFPPILLLANLLAF